MLTCARIHIHADIVLRAAGTMSFADKLLTTLKPRFGKGGGSKYDKPKDASRDKQGKEEN